MHRQTLKAKLNVRGVERDYEILSKALLRPRADGAAACERAADGTHEADPRAGDARAAPSSVADEASRSFHLRVGAVWALVAVAVVSCRTAR